MMKKTGGFRCEAHGDALDIFIYDVIFDGAAREVAVALGNIKKSSPVNVRINSVGGSVFESFAIFNQLRRHEGHVTVSIDGMAASGASVVAMGGDEIQIADNAFMMIHNASGLVLGESEDMRFLADKMDRLSNAIGGIYAVRTGNTREQVTEWMNAETWFDSDESVEHGFADSVVDKPADAPTNRLDLSGFVNVPTVLVSKPGRPKQPQSVYSRQSVETIVAGFPDIFGDLHSDAARESGSGSQPLEKEGNMPSKDLTFTEPEVKAKLEEAKAKFDLDGKAAQAKAVTEAVNTAVAETQVNAKAEQEKAVAEAIGKSADESATVVRDGIKEVLARCETAGISLPDARAMIDKDLSLEDAKDAVIAKLVKDRKAIGGELVEPGGKPKDATAKYRDEFKAAGGKKTMGITEKEYVASCIRTAAGGEILDDDDDED